MSELVSGIMPGIAAMENIHPMVVHFPIALLNAFLLMELLGFALKREELRVAATWMLYLGTLGALVAVLAGLWAESSVAHGEEVHSIMVAHRNLGIAVLSISVVLSAWRIFAKGKFSLRGQIIHLVVAFAMIVTMAFGADLGGLMVYKYGVAIKAVPETEGHGHSGAGAGAGH